MIILLGSLLSLQAQQTLYFHCKDGKSFACMTDEIDHIGFSKVGNSEYNTQIVYLKDGTRKEVLMADVDSVGFTDPQPVLADEGFLMDKSFSSYISNADTLKFTMAKNTPEEMLPKMGAVVASTFDNTAFQNGIMARVVSVSETAEGYEYQCEKAGIDDLYDEFFYYGYGDDANAEAGIRASQPTEKELWNFNFDPTVPATMLGDYTISGNSHLASKGKIKIMLHKQKGSPTHAKFWLSHRFESAMGLSLAGKKAHDFGDAIPISPWMTAGAIPTPIPGIFFTPIVKFHLYFEAAADMKMTLSGHANMDSEFLLELKDNSWSAGEVSNKFDCGVDEASLALDGWVGVGLQPEFLITLCGSQTGANIQTRVGLRLKTAFKFDASKFLEDASFYEGLKDTKFTLSIPLMAWFNAQLGLWGPSMKSADFYILNKDIPLSETYILPSFTDISANKTATGAKVTVEVADRDLFTYVDLGAAAFDENNNLVSSQYNTIYQKYDKLSGGKYTVDLEFDPEKKCTFCPIIKLFDVEMRAPGTTISDPNDLGMWYRPTPDKWKNYTILSLKNGQYIKTNLWYSNWLDKPRWEKGTDAIWAYTLSDNIIILTKEDDLLGTIQYAMYWRIEDDRLIFSDGSGNEEIYYKFTPEIQSYWDEALSYQ